LLKRSIDLIDPLGPTIGQKIFRNAKRVCVVFAVAAVALSALDLMNIRSVKSASEFVHGNRARLADLPDLILSGIQSIAMASPAPSAVAMIPRGKIALTLRPMRTAAVEPRVTSDASPATELAAPRVSNDTRPLAELAAPRVSNDAQPVAEIAAAHVSNDVSPVTEPTAARVTNDTSPVYELAAAHDLDAVEFAMTSTPSRKNAQAPFVAAPAQQPIILARADEAQLPAPTPVSLPMSNAIPTDNTVVPDMVPRPAPGAPPPSPAELLHLEGKTYAKAERCLANAIYFEARSEPVSGQIAVAQVVMNRVFSGFYPGDVCAVIYQNANRHLACQFTFACDGKSKIINERGAWARANRIATQTLEGKLYVAAVGPATHYHAIYVRPNWVREMHKMARYGIHNFYRPIAWGNGADEPVWGTAALAQAKKR
jgi:spore germination cell wall hydrolase CwlJ-like protein